MRDSFARQQLQFRHKLQGDLEAEMKKLQLPGAAIFVASARTGSWTTSLGNNGNTGREPMKPDMHFRIGSITKTFVGTVILQLVNEGKLGLDDPVAKYLPQVPKSGDITLRELLDMRSGLYNYTEDNDFWAIQDKQPNKVWTPPDLLRISFKHPRYFAPGQDYHYTNTNFIILGMIIEQVTGHTAGSENYC